MEILDVSEVVLDIPDNDSFQYEMQEVPTDIPDVLEIIQEILYKNSSLD